LFFRVRRGRLSGGPGGKCCHGQKTSTNAGTRSRWSRRRFSSCLLGWPAIRRGRLYVVAGYTAWPAIRRGRLYGVAGYASSPAIHCAPPGGSVKVILSTARKVCNFLSQSGRSRTPRYIWWWGAAPLMQGASYLVLCAFSWKFNPFRPIFRHGTIWPVV
jgi:hypothetical protein